jgi:hypothetical protein
MSRRGLHTAVPPSGFGGYNLPSLTDERSGQNTEKPESDPTILVTKYTWSITNHNVCPLVRIGTPHPLSRKRVRPPGTKGGRVAHSPVGEGDGGVPIPTTAEKA